MAWSRPGEERVIGVCRDLSLGGCFLEAYATAPVGTAVTVHVALPGLLDAAGQPSEAAIPSTVRWTTDAGMGIQFGSMGARETAALVHLIGP